MKSINEIDKIDKIKNIDVKLINIKMSHIFVTFYIYNSENLRKNIILVKIDNSL